MKITHIAIALFTLSLMSCKKYQEDGPLEYLVEQDVFDSTDKNGTMAQLYLNDVYANMPTGFNRIDGNLLDAATDDAMPSQTGTTIENIINGRISNAVTNPDGAWSKNYTGIRKVNLFLKKIDIVPKPSDIPFWKAEARFLRALFYFELVKRYGGVPLVGDTVFNYTDDIRLKRNSFDDCINYIVAECDSIKGKVKQEALSASDWGRISRGAVLALKSRTLLYAASPLYNGGVPDAATTEQKALMGYPSFSVTRWQKAAQAAQDIMTLTGSPYALEPAYTNVFLNIRTKETLLAYGRAATNDIETNNGPVGYFNLASGNGRTSPTQELVDAFPMLNGKDISDNTSGYNELTPYTNRDPRLGLTVLYNGVPWLSRPVETFEGGLDKPNLNRVQTKTGYYLRKFMGSFATATAYSAQKHNYVIFRYAEVILNYAEAQNEFAGPSAEVYKVLTDLRKRAGLQAGTNALYGLKAAMTKDEMREAIRKERRIEMAFEEHRFWDVRRWKIAGQLFNKDLTGMKITKDASGSLSYQRFAAGKILFIDSKMYLYPISFTEISKNSNLVQNYGW